MSAAALSPLVRLPQVRDALGYTENRPTLAALERHGIPILRISPRNISIRASDFEKLISRASALEVA
jgi:hypothetical protein